MDSLALDAALLPFQKTGCNGYGWGCPIRCLFMQELHRAGGSDVAMRTALVILPVLSFTLSKPLAPKAIAWHLGLSVQEAAAAVSELVAINAFEVSFRHVFGREQTLYRLSAAFATPAPAEPLAGKLGPLKSKKGAVCQSESKNVEGSATKIDQG